MAMLNSFFEAKDCFWLLYIIYSSTNHFILNADFKIQKSFEIEPPWKIWKVLKKTKTKFPVKIFAAEYSSEITKSQLHCQAFSCKY